MLESYADKTLSIVIPVYNEKDTWRELLARVEAVDLGPMRRQIVLVEDGSSDGTRDQLRQFADETANEPADAPVTHKVVFHEHNQGKGAALRTGFAQADGDLVIIQDADLEYNPDEYPMLVEPILAGQAPVVYGSRFLEKKGRKGYWKNYMANRFLTWLSNRCNHQKLTDMETCYKVFRREIIQSIHLEQDRFGFEPEVTAKLARIGATIIEKPISYDSRSHEEGKKIGFSDGLQAIRCIFRYGLFKRGHARIADVPKS